MALQTFPFAPQPATPFQFQPTLDGDVYTGVVTWNVFGQRWYLNLYTLNQTLVLAIPLVASPPDYAVDLVRGYFDTPVVFREASRTIEVG